MKNSSVYHCCCCLVWKTLTTQLPIQRVLMLHPTKQFTVACKAGLMFQTEGRFCCDNQTHLTQSLKFPAILLDCHGKKLVSVLDLGLDCYIKRFDFLLDSCLVKCFFLRFLDHYLGQEQSFAAYKSLRLVHQKQISAKQPSLKVLV